MWPAARSEEIVALCDLDHEFAAPVFKQYPKAKIYKDFRQMFDKEQKNFDALIVATPDHWHSHLVMAGLAMNKHIYCAKPMTHTIAEARKVKAAALASKVTTKASIQDSRTSPARATTELLLSGAIGPVREVHFWCGTHCPSGLARPTEVQKPPVGMNWDQWCGPSPARPYHQIYHYGNWRPWWDFGTGNLGDAGCHALHVFHQELEMGAPDWVAADACQSSTLEGWVSNTECPSASNYIQWHFPARGKHPEMMAYFYDGGLQPPRPLSMPDRHGDAGQGRDVRRRERRSALRVLRRESVGAGPYSAAAGPAVSWTPWRPTSAGEPLQGLQAARALPWRGARERIITPSGSGPAKPAGSRSRRLNSPAISRNSPCSGRPRCAATACPGVMPSLQSRVETGRADSAVVWIPSSNDGHVHVAQAPASEQQDVCHVLAKFQGPAVGREGHASSATTKQPTVTLTCPTARSGTTRSSFGNSG